MNDTKWDEVRAKMYALGENSPKWRTKDIVSGYVSGWDGDWYYHFRNGGYKTIAWLEIAIESPEQRLAVHQELRSIGVPGEETAQGYRVFGYVVTGQFVDYIR